MRVLLLTWNTTRRAPLKTITLILLFAIAIVVFALISELSRVSKQGLDEGIARDSGELGTYEVAFGSELNGDAALRDRVEKRVAMAVGGELVASWIDLPSKRSECPPYDKVGDTKLRVMWSASGEPVQLPFGETAGLETRWCLDGLEIPQSGFYLADESRRATLGERLYLRPDYADLVRLSDVSPVTHGFTLHVGRGDASPQILDEAKYLLAEQAMRLGVEPETLVSVWRVDQDADSVRAAAEGISMTYEVMRWAVLGLAGAAIVAMQTTTASHRAWFYGLARAMGTRSRSVVTLIATESVCIIAGGALLALALLALGQGLVYDFAKSSFGVDAHVINLSLFSALVVGLAIAMALAIAVPVVTILRRDPLSVLEAPRG